MGRYKKHPELRRIEGNPSKRAIDELLIVPDGDPIPPDHLSDNATAAFGMIVRSMPPGVYSVVDSFLLAAFAEAWSIHKQASIALQGQPLVVQGAKGGQVENPLLRIVNAQAKIMVSLGGRLGLDPAARLNLSIADERRPRSKFDDLLGGVRCFDA
jgi:P27 family predicted phage terminase small subunit